MIKIKIKRALNSPPIDNTPVEFNTQSKVSGFGLTTSDNVIGPSGDPFRASSALPRHAMEEGAPEDTELGYEKPGFSIFKEDHCGCQCEDCAEESEGVKYFEEYLAEGLDESLLYEKRDRCYYQAKQKYDVFPSAYASGYIVRCRKGQLGRKKKSNEEVELDEEWSDKYKRSIDCDNPKGFSQRAHCQGRKEEELALEEIELDEASDYEYVEDLEEGTFDKEKSQGLHGWFARKGGKGKSKGWVDCNTCRTNPKTGRKTCKSCGRQSGEKRSKYPACRPTPSACTRTGTSKKKSSTRVSWKPKKKKEE